MSPDFGALCLRKLPFRHWVADDFITTGLVREINAAWPTDGDWQHEKAGWVVKSALLFPRRLHAPAQALAAALYAPDALAQLSARIGLDLLPDPWFTDGPLEPKLGGGLHEIGPGGRLGVHVDFEAHPAGLCRVANLLIYLNEDWQPKWGGALELHGETAQAAIAPAAGRAVLFRTTADSWHGHPQPLACPPGRTRRSLALYYYARRDGDQRPKTVYRRKD